MDMEKAFRNYFKDNILGDIECVPEGKVMEDHFKFKLYVKRSEAKASLMTLPWTFESLEKWIGDKRFFIRALIEGEDEAGDFLYVRIYFE